MALLHPSAAVLQVYVRKACFPEQQSSGMWIGANLRRLFYTMTLGKSKSLSFSFSSPFSEHFSTRMFTQSPFSTHAHTHWNMKGLIELLRGTWRKMNTIVALVIKATIFIYKTGHVNSQKKTAGRFWYFSSAVCLVASILLSAYDFGSGLCVKLPDQMDQSQTLITAINWLTMLVSTVLSAWASCTFLGLTCTLLDPFLYYCEVSYKSWGAGTLEIETTTSQRPSLQPDVSIHWCFD